MGIAERKEKEKRAMRQRILVAAMELFVDFGFQRVSIRNIAEKIEYSPSTIYLYFSDKNAILLELLNEGLDRLNEKILQHHQIADPVDRLIAYERCYLEFALENPQYYEIMFIQGLPIQRPEDGFATEKGERLYKVFEELLAECQAAGHLQNQNVRELTILLWSTLHGFCSLYIRQRLRFANIDDASVHDFIERTLLTIRSWLR
ncbi:MAG: TetR/AcrR family transcriptional regulator [bacterium]|nr:TetR/AcrR family transcriptional regulator [bacterium]